LRRNCLIKRITEGKVEGRIVVTGRRGGRRWKLLEDVKERRGHRKLKEEALGRTCGEVALGERMDLSLDSLWMKE